MALSDINSTVKSYLLQEFLPDSSEAELKDDTPLISGGILDSIGTIKLVGYLENQFGVQFEAHEMGADHLNSLGDISAIVQSKLK